MAHNNTLDGAAAALLKREGGAADRQAWHLSFGSVTLSADPYEGNPLGKGAEKKDGALDRLTTAVSLDSRPRMLCSFTVFFRPLHSGAENTPIRGPHHRTLIGVVPCILSLFAHDF